MPDLFLDGNFEVELDGNGDLKEVDGKERVRQSVTVHITEAMYEKVGEALDVEKHLDLAISRALQTHGLLERTERVDINQVGSSSKYEVTINYRTNAFSFEVETGG